MEPSAGHVASLAASLLFVPLPPVQVDVDPDGSLTATISDESTFLKIAGSSLTLWGVPADPSHDTQRCDQLGFTCGQSAGVPPQPFMTNPTDCSSGPLTTRLSVTSWQDQGTSDTMTSDLPAPTGCDALEFDPSITFGPDGSAADSAAGFSTNVHIPQDESPDGLATPALRKAVVTLPPGVSINPAGADGLDACTPAQIGLGNNNPATCPNASKVGTVQIDTPLLAEPLTGSIFVKPDLGIYVVAEGGGVHIKLNGVAVRDPDTGQLTITFDNTPQVPFSDFTLNFFGGPRSALATPPECGTYKTTSELTPWSAPGSGPAATPSDSFDITTGPGGGPCSRPFAPSFQAGTQNPVAGASSPFIVRLSRADGTEQLGSLDMDLPPGMLAKLAGVPQCSNAQATAANCPSGSRVGGVSVGAGAGTQPEYVRPARSTSPGRTRARRSRWRSSSRRSPVPRPRHGRGPEPAPDRHGRRPGPRGQRRDSRHPRRDPTPHPRHPPADRPARLHAGPDQLQPAPGDRTDHGSEGGSASLAKPFAVAGCAALPFAPTLGASILNGSAGTSRSSHPALRVDVGGTPGGANILGADVLLPPAFQVDQANLGNLCSESELVANRCAGKNTIGTATATTPLLDQQLSGPVYAVSGSGGLPRLAMILNGRPRASRSSSIVRGRHGHPSATRSPR